MDLDQLLARAEHDAAIAQRRLELLQEISQDWSWWQAALAGTGAVAGTDLPAKRPAPAGGPSAGQQSVPRPCEECGRSFQPARPWAKYCGDSCRTKAGRRRHHEKQRRQAEPEPEIDAASLEPLADFRDRPLFVPDRHDDDWIKQTLRPPRLSIEEPAR